MGKWVGALTWIMATGVDEAEATIRREKKKIKKFCYVSLDRKCLSGELMLCDTI